MVATLATGGRAAHEPWDVVVFSGVPCGLAAAVTAAREGARVLLIEPTRHVGGLSTSGINTAETEHMLKWTIGGFADEFYRLLGRRMGTGQPAYYFESGVAERCYLDLVADAKVTVRYGVRVERVVKDGARLTALALSDGTTVAAPVFVDASYEGDAMARAGVSYAVGRESRAEYGEEAAGVRFDKTIRRAPTTDAEGRLLPGITDWARNLTEGDAHRGVMNYNFRLTVTNDPAQMAPIPQPEHYDRGRFALLEGWLRGKAARREEVRLEHILDIYRRTGGRHELNNKQSAIFSLGHFGGQFDWPDADWPQRDAIFADHWDYTLGLLHFLATEDCVPEPVRASMRTWGLHRGEFADNGYLPYQLYVREARRMKGVRVVTQADVQTDRRKADSIGFSSHFIDSHHVQRLALSPSEFLNEGRIWRMGYAYQIPYSSLTPRPEQAVNLLVPGAASFSHVAFCSYRLESVWMIAGHAAGVAAAMAAKGDGRVAEVDVAELQAKLRAQKQVVDFAPGQPEKCEHLNGPEEF